MHRPMDVKNTYSVLLTTQVYLPLHVRYMFFRVLKPSSVMSVQSSFVMFLY